MLATINVLSYARCGRCCLKRRLNVYIFFLTKEMTHFSSCPKKLISAAVLFTVGHSSGLCVWFGRFLCMLDALPHTTPKGFFSSRDLSFLLFNIQQGNLSKTKRSLVCFIWIHVYSLFVCLFMCIFFKQQKKKNRKNAHHTQKVVNIKCGIKAMLSEICYKM